MARIAQDLSAAEAPHLWRLSPWQWPLIVVAAAAAVMMFPAGVDSMLSNWGKDEYSHGYMLPLVSCFLVWQRRAQLVDTVFARSWLGVLVTLVGLGVAFAGELATLFPVVQYGSLIMLGGLFLTLMGWSAFKIVLPAYVLLYFAVPLPDFLYNNLASQLQLISSQLGVWVIRLAGISVYLEGNVIDLGNYQLQVVEACSGLRYLFPFSALGFIAAIIFRGALWKKALLVLSTAPIAVLMNSFRIGVIGILVQYAGVGMAEGFLHDFEGWIVFMACTAILVLEMWILAKLGRHPLPFGEAFAIDAPPPLPRGARLETRRFSAPFYVSSSLLLAGVLLAQLVPNRAELVPDRVTFAFFPMSIGEWSGERGTVEGVYLDRLRLDDYLIADYASPAGPTVNLYVAYYESQRKGSSTHSPKSCLPGGGWRILDLSRRELPGIDGEAGGFRINRALTQMGDRRLLVYYWFQQRGRIIANEYLVKWYLLWDALTRQRTDGAMVRVTIEAAPGQDLDALDETLSDFVRVIEARLGRFVPG